MYAVPALELSLSAGDWEGVAAHLDSSFYRLLIVAPDSLTRVFESAPRDWLERDPRSAHFCALFRAVQNCGQVLDPTAFHRFEGWVSAQANPTARDRLGLEAERLRQMLARGWFTGAASLTDEILVEMSRPMGVAMDLDDVAPVVIRLCGVAKLLVGSLDAAASCFSEAVKWSSDPMAHPMSRFAKEHLALVHALEERYAAARHLVSGQHVSRSSPGTVTYLYESAGILARALVAMATMDFDECHRLLAQIDMSMSSGHFGWVALHVRAKMALLDGGFWPAIHDIATYLVQESHRTHPGTFAGSTLRADLVALYQAVGDLAAAEQVLGHPALPTGVRSIVMSRARHSMMRGRPYEAVRMLRQPCGGAGTAVPVRGAPSGAVLYAAAELAASGKMPPSLLEFVASSIDHHEAYEALAHASPALQDALRPRLRRELPVIPTPWAYRDRVKLTSRERQVLQALREHPTVSLVAAALHISPNTAKCHVRSLYRKLGAHTRDEALWLGNDEGM
ncbi:hypothetical protein C5C03_00100 [Clavibacter michiganensis]|uniref:helix-turn-helix transcriptional regulator n=1 Tax=Clavibacter michiganensis TaxID=28447 RepID=UPI000CE83544|nr:LuxR C-terminal-related transcriptional regulator [Clavibacter michiganensis]PPF91266.1 hypothetical protein C5C03_00100 [Clavibacter michiganensis]PPF99308.1 hypothetical protein C5C05_01905 [Clavibacter michiganensis]